MTNASAYLVGGGIASLAAAVLLVRDADWEGRRIHIFEQSSVLGGSLDGAGTPEAGYVMRGGRMFEAQFRCTFDLLDSIPTLDDPNVSVTAEIKAFTQAIRTSSNCRLVDNGTRVEAPAFELSFGDRIRMALLAQRSEKSLGNMTIADYFSDAFLDSNFWAMWCTMFAFQSWHSVAEFRRYVRRFMHLLPGFNRLEGIHRTRLNQHDSIVAPVVRWLKQQGVNFHLNARVHHIAFDHSRTRVTGFEYRFDGAVRRMDTAQEDRIFITLGSMTEASAIGSMSAAPERPSDAETTGSWSLWQRLAGQSANFGEPDTFCAHRDRTSWTSFTVTLQDPRFFRFMESFTGNKAGTGGLVTFKRSGWLMSVVLPHQPHFADQPDDTWVFWGYGLHAHCTGNHVDKPMAACNGSEILEELSHHLGLAGAATDLLAAATCIPCSMPYITAQFMPRMRGTRPRVIPPGASNFAFLGQFVELPDDTVFTVEYSVRTAQEAVYGLTDTDHKVTPLYRGYLQPGVIARALVTILRNGASP